MKQCPKCSYQRLLTDVGLSEDVCPGCGVVYNKFIVNPDQLKIKQIKQQFAQHLESENDENRKSEKKDWFKWLLIKIVAGVAMFYGLLFLVADYGFVILVLPLAAFFIFKKIKNIDFNNWSFSKKICNAGVFLILLISVIPVVLNPQVQPDTLPKKPVPLTYEQKIRTGFSGWDGSHRDFVMAIKKSMNDPDSFEHVETVYRDNQNGTLRVVMTFRGNNMFGAKILSETIALSDIETGKVIVVLE